MNVTDNTTHKAAVPTLEEKIAKAGKWARVHVEKLIAFIFLIWADYFLIVRKPLDSAMADKKGISDWIGTLDNTGAYWRLLLGLLAASILFGGLVYQAVTAIGATVERRRLETVKMTRDSIEQLLIKKGIIH